MIIKPARVIILSFLVVIAIGSLLLSLPFSTTRPIPFIDILFTSTSATCVTGLTVISVCHDLTSLGKIILMVLFQLGGLGIMTFSTMFALILSKRITIKERQVLTLTFGETEINFRALLILIFTFTFLCEMLSAIGIYLIWHNYNFFYALFHAISGFCNAGFSLFPDSLARFRSNIFFNFIMYFLIITGGIGFLVIFDLVRAIKNKIVGKRYRITIHTKIVLTTTLILILIGSLFLFLLEKGNLYKDFSSKEVILSSFFQSITARTAGFSTIDISNLTSSSKLILMGLMFIGASPGSTGGGIKTVSFVLVLMGVFAILRGRKQLILFKRAIPLDIFRKAVVIFLLSFLWIVIAVFLLTIFEKEAFINILFEVISAFGTVGLSCGITTKLTLAGKLVIILTMFLGRIGPLTLAIALGFKETGDYKLPEERVMIG